MGVGSKEKARKTISEVECTVPERKLGVEAGKQARKSTPEANREVPERKLGAEESKKAKKPMLWVWEAKKKQEKPSQKLNAQF